MWRSVWHISCYGLSSKQLAKPGAGINPHRCGDQSGIYAERRFMNSTASAIGTQASISTKPRGSGCVMSKENFGRGVMSADSGTAGR